MRRLFAAIVEIVIILVLLSFCLFMLLGLMPGDPFAAMIAADARLTPDDVARLRAQYGLDQPLWKRYLAWVQDIMRGELGFSRLYGQPVFDLLLSHLKTTVIVMLPAFLLALVMAFGMGLVAAWYAHRDKVQKRLLQIATVTIALPTFWLAILAVLLFAVTLRWLPASTSGAISMRELILPVMVLAIGSFGTYALYLREGLLEALNKPHALTAQSKGLSKKHILIKHVMPHGLLPMITVVALGFGHVFSGALVVESIFGIPGLGRLIFQGVMGSDFPLAMAGLLFGALIILVCNRLADILYRMVDPRITG